MKHFVLPILAILLFLGSCSTTQPTPANSTTVYISTFTGNQVADAIYQLELDALTGTLTFTDTISGVNDPSYFALYPEQDLLLVAERPAVKGEAGKLTSFRLTDEGAVRLNSVSAAGPNPCYVSVDASGRYALVANYKETIASFAIQEDGRLSEAISVQRHQRATPAPPRQEMGHPHMIHPLRDNVVLVTDLGVDSLFHYELSEEGVLQLVTRTATAPGAGPRHFAVHPIQDRCYVLNELNRTVEVFQLTDSRQPMKHLQTIPVLTQDDKRVTAAAIRIHPSGRYLYTSNRGQEDSSINSISIFQIDKANGQLRLIDETDTQGHIPRDFNISPDGRLMLVANRKTNSVVVFRIDAETGRLTETGARVQIAEPVCVGFGG